jgi:hypothetical protein
MDVHHLIPGQRLSHQFLFAISIQETRHRARQNLGRVAARTDLVCCSTLGRGDIDGAALDRTDLDGKMGNQNLLRVLAVQDTFNVSPLDLLRIRHTFTPFLWGNGWKAGCASTNNPEAA